MSGKEILNLSAYESYTSLSQLSTVKSSLNLKSTILKATHQYAEQFVFMMKMENALGEIELEDEETFRDD